jgi:sulfatase maturation enzyme AslB (radical SAM superfamily)
MKSHFSLILLSTLQCNADCEYCFENKTDDRLTLDRLGEMIRKVLDYDGGEITGVADDLLAGRRGHVIAAKLV